MTIDVGKGEGEEAALSPRQGTTLGVWPLQQRLLPQSLESALFQQQPEAAVAHRHRLSQGYRKVRREGRSSLSQGPEACVWKKGSPPEAGHPVHCRAFLVCSHVEGGTSLLPGNGTVQWPGAVQAHKGARPLTKGLCFLRADITRQSLSELIKGWLHPGWSACQPPGPRSSWQQAP